MRDLSTIIPFTFETLDDLVSSVTIIYFRELADLTVHNANGVFIVIMNR